MCFFVLFLQDTGALMRCSVKDTMDVLPESAIHAKVDPLRGVSENIILDQLPRKGNSFDLLFDREKININAYYRCWNGYRHVFFGSDAASRLFLCFITFKGAIQFWLIFCDAALLST